MQSFTVKMKGVLQVNRGEKRLINDDARVHRGKAVRIVVGGVTPGSRSASFSFPSL